MATRLSERFKHWQVREWNGTVNVTTGSFSEVQGFTAKRLLPGVYRVSWYFEARRPSPGTTSALRIRALIDDAQLGTTILPLMDDEWEGHSGWDFVTLADGDQPVLSFQARRVGGSDTLNIRRVKFALERMR